VRLDRSTLVGYLVGTRLKRQRYSEAKCRCRLEIYDQFELEHSCPNRDAFQTHRMCSRPTPGKDEMDAMLIGAPFGLGVLIALGVLLAVMNHLSQ
jgi:hypothetical protein